jgi:hypothetical protein
MAGLSSAVTNKDIISTTMPSWYEAAQQGAVNQAMNVAPGQVDPNISSALSNVFAPGSGFTAGQSILENIGTGIANPWLTSASGEVTPNTASPLGGYIQSQRDYMNQMLPGAVAESTAGRISGGDFGSSMNRAADIAARGKVMGEAEQRQLKAILDSQQTGVAAGAGLGNLANALTQGATNAMTFQANLPYAQTENLAKILGNIKTGQTQTTTKELGALNQILGLMQAGSSGLKMLQGGDYVRDSQGNILKDQQGKPIKTTGLLGQIGVSGGVGGLLKGAYDWATGTQPLPTNGSSYYDQAGNYVFTDQEGNTSLIDPNTGQVIQTYESGSYGNPEEDQGGGGGSYDENYPEFSGDTSGDVSGDTSGGFYDDYTGEYIAPDYNFNDD